MVAFVVQINNTDTHMSVVHKILSTYSSGASLAFELYMGIDPAYKIPGTKIENLVEALKNLPRARDPGVHP